MQFATGGTGSRYVGRLARVMEVRTVTGIANIRGDTPSAGATASGGVRGGFQSPARFTVTETMCGVNMPRKSSTTQSRSTSKHPFPGTESSPSSHAASDAAPSVTIHISYHTKRREPRATYVLPTGECPLENWWYVKADQAKHYSVQLIEGGPFMSSVQACQWGRHHSCETGRHGDCPPKPWAVSGDLLEHRDEQGYWRPVYDEAGRAMLVLPVHVWRCSCICHPAELRDVEQGDWLPGL